MLINELIGNYFAEVYWANTGMPIWDPSTCIWYNDTHPRFNFHLEFFLHLKWLSHYIELPTKTHGYYVKKVDIITQDFPCHPKKGDFARDFFKCPLIFLS